MTHAAPLLTTPGTWALIRVIKGRLLYRVLDPASERVLDLLGALGLVEPRVPHEVAPLGTVAWAAVEETFYTCVTRAEDAIELHVSAFHAALVADVLDRTEKRLRDAVEGIIH